MSVLESLFLINKTPQVPLDTHLKIRACVGKIVSNLRCLLLLDQKVVGSQYEGPTFFLFFFETDHAGFLIEVDLVEGLLDELNFALSNNVYSVSSVPLLGDHVTIRVEFTWSELVHQAL